MTSEKKFRVSEIFGPTIQGEGRHAGTPCYFIRFGGCDFRCSWCDTPYAVLPKEVAKLPQMTALDICAEILTLKQSATWVVLSGGNPALFDLEDLILELQSLGYKVMMETQGSIYKAWFAKLDEVCISPKPPSSGMTDKRIHINTLDPNMYIKIVIFDEEDYEWARDLKEAAFHDVEVYLSVGNEDPSLPTVSNPVPVYLPDPTFTNDIDSTRFTVLDKTAWLFEKVANDPAMQDVRVIPQLHTLAWGNKRGV